MKNMILNWHSNWQLGNSHDIVLCMLYWIYLVVCERSILCCIVYFVFQMYFFSFTQLDRTKPKQPFKNIYTFISFTQFHSMKPIQLLKTYEKSVSNFYMEIINTSIQCWLCNLPTIHLIQRYNGLCELTNWFINAGQKPTESIKIHSWRYSKLFPFL